MRAILAGALAAAVALGLFFGIRAAGGGEEAPANTLANVEAGMRARLDAKYLSYRWVACVASRHRYEGVRVYRCNVNFGDPHVEAYCAAYVGGELVTHHELRGVRCDRVRTAEGQPLG